MHSIILPAAAVAAAMVTLTHAVKVDLPEWAQDLGAKLQGTIYRLSDSSFVRLREKVIKGSLETD